MKIALVIFGALLAFAAIGSAVSKLKKVPDVMTAMGKVGVQTHQIPMLAFLEIAGGLGIIVGIWAPSIGVLASACLALYFAGALYTHFSRKHKVADFGAALGIFIIACVTTFLQLKR
ncbi:MAG: DoxX family protein [Actinomycetes bacterium]